MPVAGIQFTNVAGAATEWDFAAFIALVLLVSWLRPWHNRRNKLRTLGSTDALSQRLLTKIIWLKP